MDAACSSRRSRGRAIRPVACRPRGARSRTPHHERRWQGRGSESAGISREASSRPGRRGRRSTRDVHVRPARKPASESPRQVRAWRLGCRRFSCAAATRSSIRRETASLSPSGARSCTYPGCIEMRLSPTPKQDTGTGAVAVRRRRLTPGGPSRAERCVVGGAAHGCPRRPARGDHALLGVLVCRNPPGVAEHEGTLNAPVSSRRFLASIPVGGVFARRAG